MSIVRGGPTAQMTACAPLHPLFRVIAMLAICLVAACGRLAVQVDVINPGYVESVVLQAELESQLRQAFEPAAIKQARYDRIEADLNAGLEDVIAQAAGDGTELGRAEAESLRLTKALVLAEYRELVGKLAALDSEIRQAVAEQPGAIDLTDRRLNTLLLSRQATAAAGVADVLSLLDEIPIELGASGGQMDAGDPNPQTGQAGAVQPSPALARAKADLTKLTGGLTLTESPYAYAVASAPATQWANFNGTLGRGVFGNLNTAIKMEGLADFTIKGVTFDPTKVAQVASKVTTQSLLLATQIAGVPVAGLSLGAADTGSALASQSDALAKVVASNQRFVARSRLRQDAVMALLSRMAEEQAKDNLTGDAARRAEAHRAIGATYEAYKAALQYPAPSDAHQ